jgi:hypothetical protein
MSGSHPASKSDERAGLDHGGADQQITAANWYHVAFTSDDVDLRLYVNGQEEGTAVAHTTGMCAASDPITVGALANGAFSFNGQLDECAVFGTALTAAEICDICRFGIDGLHDDRGAQCGNCTETP